jgi:citrate synthase
MTPSPAFIDAAEAVARLGIRRASLYAYASRGLVRTAAHPADPRGRLYSAADVDALVRRKSRSRRPAAAAATALDWGMPVLETRLSRIAGGKLAYRGSDAVLLAETATLEDVARLLWDTREADPFAGPAGSIRGHPRKADAAGSPTDRAIRRLAEGLGDEPPGLSGAPLLARAAALLRMVGEVVAGAPLGGAPMHEALARAWERPGAADQIRRALVLCADHELNASAFAVRVVASTGASLTASVVAGLAALSGPRHGGMTGRVAAFFDECREARDGAAAVHARLARGDDIPGFGHPLYPDGDPRAAALLAAIRPPASILDIFAAVADATGQTPSIDAALVALERTKRLPRGAALAVFALGRTVGWLAHAMEQRQSGQLIRPRAAYSGNSSS